MALTPFRSLILIVLAALVFAGCANIVPPEGGKKDVTPPKLVSVLPVDSQLNTRVTEIELTFNEYVVVSDAATQVTISPMLPFPLNVEGNKKKVTVTIPDSLLQENTTYRLSFGNAIKDLRENNPFTGYTYTFSTGSYFDSLQLQGSVFNAATGLPDSGSLVMLYSADKSDSIVVKERPMYVTRVQTGGLFSFKGLPARRFRIYALKDGNGNMIYDGGQEWIAFQENTVMPADSATENILLRIFPEPITDTVQAVSSDRSGRVAAGKRDKPEVGATDFSYRVAVDTSDNTKRTFDVTDTLTIALNRDSIILNEDKVFLSYDSADIEVQADAKIWQDTALNMIKVYTDWKENTLYTLRLLKGFATDTAGTEAMPSKYIFRTKSSDDYAKLRINVPSAYYGNKYLLVVVNATDTVYQKPVADTTVNIIRLKPDTYSVRVIADENENGKWDSGDLFAKKQPEKVIPLQSGILLKAGWENTVDLKEDVNVRKGAARQKSPIRRDSRR